MKVIYIVFIVCVIVAAVNAKECEDKDCPDSQYCVQVMGTYTCVHGAKKGRSCSDEPNSNGVYDMTPPCASGLTCDTSRTVVNSAHDSDGLHSLITNHSTTDSVCCASISFRSYHPTPFAAVWNVRKASIASFTLLTGNHRHLGRHWCNEWQTWTMEWNDIVFIGESRFCLQHHDGRIRVRKHRRGRLLICCVMHRHTGLAPSIMVWGDTLFHCCASLVLIAGKLNSQRYISEILESMILPYIQCLPSATFQLDNVRPHMAFNVQEFFLTHLVELLS
ncbi:transposable element Tcb1 transposase [Trichonephila clavipes]|nr:transposable element Tcb1 transposase [Trichonephila clavipes]